MDKAYIEDGFNLYGLRNMVPNFQDTLDFILDRLGTKYWSTFPEGLGGFGLVGLPRRSFCLTFDFLLPYPLPLLSQRPT